MKTQNKILFGIFILIGIGVLVLLVSGEQTLQEADNQPTSTAEATKQWATSTNQNEELSVTYTNHQHEFQFDYPADWRVGDTDTSDGTFQLFNYTEDNGGSGHEFAEGNNKIEMAITNRSRPATSSVFVETDREETEVTIDGTTAIRTASTLQGGSQTLSYTIPLPQASSTFFNMTVHGDPENFDVLEEMVNTFNFLYHQPASNQIKGPESEQASNEFVDFEMYTNEEFNYQIARPKKMERVSQMSVKNDGWSGATFRTPGLRVNASLSVAAREHTSGQTIEEILTEEQQTLSNVQLAETASYQDGSAEATLEGRKENTDSELPPFNWRKVVVLHEGVRHDFTLEYYDGTLSQNSVDKTFSSLDVTTEDERTRGAESPAVGGNQVNG